MPALLTRADSLREFLTGAGSDGGSQVSVDACFGNFRSSTEALSFGIQLTSALTNVSVDYASGGNAPGAGTLTCVSANDLAWNDNGESQGPTVNLPSNGSTAILEASGNAGAYIRVTRTSGSAMSGGPCTVTLTTLVNGFFGFPDVTSAQASAGISQYRASIVKNVASGSVLNFLRWITDLAASKVSDGGVLGASGSGTITTTGSFSTWPNTGYAQIMHSDDVTLREVVYYTSRSSTVLTVPAAGRGLLGTSAGAGNTADIVHSTPGVAIALDVNGVQAAGSAIATIAGATTAPAGVTWNLGFTSALGLNIGTLTTGQQIGIWLWRQIPAGAISTPLANIQFSDSYDAA